ncbi:unnamed protein product, partial [marine sediment metagenome]
GIQSLGKSITLSLKITSKPGIEIHSAAEGLKAMI